MSLVDFSAAAIPGQPEPDIPDQPGKPVPPQEPGEPTVPDQPPPVPGAEIEISLETVAEGFDPGAHGAQLQHFATEHNMPERRRYPWFAGQHGGCSL